MKFDAGTWIAIAAVLFFYLRLIILQRQRGKSASSNKTANTPGLMTNKLLLGTGAALMIIGAALSGIPGMPETFRGLWWLPVTIGIVVMSFGIR